MASLICKISARYKATLQQFNISTSYSTEYSGPSEQGTHWGQYIVLSFVYREFVLFSEVVSVLKL